MSIKEKEEKKNEEQYETVIVLDHSFEIVHDKYFRQNTFKSELSFALISRKNTDFTMLDSKNSTTSRERNLKASLAMFTYSVIYSIATLIGKFLGMYYPEVENSATNLIRGFIVVIIAQIVFTYNGISIKAELTKNWSKTKLLLWRCFFGALCNFCLFQSLQNMRISSAFTIFNVSPIITTILSVIFLGFTMTNMDIFAFVSCFFSVILITKPAFIFPSDGESEDKLIGIIWALAGMSFSGVAVFLNKKIGKDFHFISNLYIMGVFFIIISLFFLMISENGLRTMTFYSLFLASLMSVVFFASISCLAYSLSIGDPVKILPITYSGVVINSFYNVLIFHQSFDIFDFIGSFIIISVNVYNTLKK